MEKFTSQQRILVVDDNQDAAEMLQVLLQLEGYEVRVAFSGESGLSEAADFLPNVTCSDLSMPGMSGFELASAIRKSSHSRSTHLIATTGLNTDENLRDVKAVGFDACFIKPFNFDEFIAYVQSVFAKA